METKKIETTSGEVKSKADEMEIEKLRRKFVGLLKATDNSDKAFWAENANMRKVDGVVYIQVEGDDWTFPKGEWHPIKDHIACL